MSILESDWKKFKGLRKLALDRFFQGVLADAKAIAEHGALSAHARYGMLYGLIHDRNKDIPGPLTITANPVPVRLLAYV